MLPTHTRQSESAQSRRAARRNWSTPGPGILWRRDWSIPGPGILSRHDWSTPIQGILLGASAQGILLRHSLSSTAANSCEQLPGRPRRPEDKPPYRRRLQSPIQIDYRESPGKTNPDDVSTRGYFLLSSCLLLIAQNSFRLRAGLQSSSAGPQ